MRIKYNSKGEVISGIRILKDEAYGTGGKYENGEPIIDWDKCRTEYSDERGFDIRNTEENGSYVIEVVLPKGTTIIRFGPETGKFTAPLGTDFSKLSLPYLEDSCEYNEYRVAADSVTVFCVVDKGKVAPMFDSPGGGVQYFHLDGTVKSLVRRSILERVSDNERKQNAEHSEAGFAVSEY